MLHAQIPDFVAYNRNDHKVRLTYFQQFLVLDIKLKHKKHNAVFRNYDSGAGRALSWRVC